ncbi:MAG: gamma-glutamylcyclotransferase [Actinomycetota bacterium]
MSDGAERRLAVYGTLAPGRPNEHVLAPLGGTWTVGIIRGELRQEGWGADLGYPGIVLHPDGPTVEVHLLESAGLPDRWAELDEYEGPGYRRVVTDVLTDDGSVPANVYVLAPVASPPSDPTDSH